ncbi:MAG: response regulator [Halomonas sp.]|uniref:response regulator n=1 Tax=Halomonas sp. BC1 TaxID=1670448 RepID=UPI0009C12F54|nr:response regulator transcription factor [Halomonas sp. BC1]NGO90826.1 response regulator [Halomonas sp.]
MTPESARILIVDDEPAIRQFLRISLGSQGFCICEASTGSAALHTVRERLTTEPIDLILLDLGLPDIDGHQVLRTLRQQVGIPIIIVSVRGQEAEKVRALDSGANDYVTKPFGIQELLARIRALLRQHPPTIAPPRYQCGALSMDIAAHRVTLHGETIHLTRKEFAVLQQLISQAGRIVTQTHLLRTIWGPSHEDDTHYLRIVISKLRQKLDDDPQAPSLLQTEQGIGYRLCVEFDHEDMSE